MAARETFSSKLGTLMVLVGSAVGLGNIWRFPFLVGKYGAPFLLCYVICMLLLSIPILNCELLLGRFSRSNAYRAFKEHGRRSVWKLVGIVTLTVPFLIFSYYCVVGGWTLDYLVKSLTFQFVHSTHEQIAAMFTTLSTGTWIPLIWTLVFFLATAGVIVIGVKGGIERFSKYMMPVLFLIIVGLTVWGLTLPGASKGLDLMFNLGSTPFGVETIVVAMGQSFYSMSLGAGVMITYGSYMAEDENILASSFKTAFLDFLFALVASMAMLPATCAFGYDPGQGAGLAFNTMPMIFAKMPGGSICAIVFFLALVIAALTSTVSLMEANIAFFVDEKKMGRIKAAGIVLAGAIVIGALSSLSFGPLANVKIFGLTIFNTVDQLCANLLMPICGLFGCLFVGWQLSKKDVRAELTNKGSLALPGKSFNLLYFIIRYVAPILLVMVMVANFLVGSTE
ncbi:MAG: sodium-dependent transporter [Bacteroidales bacterium]|nr:sodium-dependent transporter [Bacteroidales bacterium]